jgi:hypothetical protein
VSSGSFQVINTRCLDPGAAPFVLAPAWGHRRRPRCRFPQTALSSNRNRFQANKQSNHVITRRMQKEWSESARGKVLFQPRQFRLPLAEDTSTVPVGPPPWFLLSPWVHLPSPFSKYHDPECVLHQTPCDSFYASEVIRPCAKGRRKAVPGRARSCPGPENRILCNAAFHRGASRSPNAPPTNIA